jgi:Ca-activated chloride channel family protein
MTRRTAAFVLSFPQLTLSQDAAVFRSGVSLVRVDAAVSDASGRILTDLKKEDFRVFDNGIPQPIVSFSFEEEPLDVVLLFDTGGNMQSKFLPLLRAVELGFHELKRGDRAAVMVYSGVAVQLLALTPDFAAVNEAILLQVLKQHFGGASKLVAAAEDAARKFQAEPASQRRRAILVITDKTAAKNSPNDVAIRDLWQTNVVLSELILDHAPQPTDTVVEQTGGATIPAGNDPGGAFVESLRRLRRRYTLYYAMPSGSPGTERTIRVEVRPDTHVFARKGYRIA